MKVQYKTIKEPSEGLYKEKGSRFVSFAFPVDSEKEVKSHLNKIKKIHYECNHHCYAFRLGAEGSTFRSSDDREPSGSAGKPILNQILSHDLTDIMIVVARYFGGSLLGVPGLINAYRSAAADAIHNATVITKTVTEQLHLSFPYMFQKDIITILHKFNSSIIDEKYGEVVQLKIEIAIDKKQQLIDSLKNTSFNPNISISDKV